MFPPTDRLPRTPTQKISWLLCSGNVMHPLDALVEVDGLDFAPISSLEILARNAALLQRSGRLLDATMQTCARSTVENRPQHGHACHEHSYSSSASTWLSDLVLAREDCVEGLSDLVLRLELRSRDRRTLGKQANRNRECPPHAPDDDAQLRGRLLRSRLP